MTLHTAQLIVISVPGTPPQVVLMERIEQDTQPPTPPIYRPVEGLSAHDQGVLRGIARRHLAASQAAFNPPAPKKGKKP